MVSLDKSIEDNDKQRILKLLKKVPEKKSQRFIMAL